jgi:uncharacterized phage protein (TIGR02218 family)
MSTTLYYCSGDRDITYNGITYLCGRSLTGGQGGPFLGVNTKFALHQKIGVETDTMTFDVIPGEAMVLGEPFLQACQDGTFDGATISIDRAFMPTYGDMAAGIVNVFTGRVGEVDAGRSLATFTINSWLEVLNQQLPRNLYQVTCLNLLGDSECGINLEAHAANFTIAAGSTQAVLQITGTSGSGTIYQLGKVIPQTGLLAGLSRSIRDCSFSGGNGTVTLLGPLPSIPAIGTTVRLYQGCNKLLNDPNGCPKFNNQGAFRGFPYIPQPDTAT